MTLTRTRVLSVLSRRRSVAGGLASASGLCVSNRTVSEQRGVTFLELAAINQYNSRKSFQVLKESSFLRISYPSVAYKWGNDGEWKSGFNLNTRLSV